MFRRILLTLLISIVLCTSFKEPYNVFNVQKGFVSFRSDAPLELINPSSTEMNGIVETDKKEFAFSVNIKSFTGFNSAIQKEHFNENYLESNKFPTATFVGKIIEDINFTKNSTVNIRAKGILTIHGVQQERIIKSDITIHNGIISIKSNFTVLLADHNIPIPKVVHEKLASEIKVEVNGELKPR